MRMWYLISYWCTSDLLQFRQRVLAYRAAVLRREQHRLGGRVVDRLHGRHAVAELERGLERFGQALLDVLADLEAIDHRFDGVLDPQRQRRHRIDRKSTRLNYSH